MNPADAELLRALRDPADVGRWSPQSWSRLLHQARAHGLLGRLASRVHAAGASAVPPALAGHFDSALRLCRAQQAEVEREARYLRAALQTLGTPVVVLKGAAYALARLPAAQGRLFSDIDLLVPKSSLAKAESLLQLHGWMGTAQTAYDQRYYREWMHELPPMVHVHRQTTLDLHHTILPETARLRPDAGALLAAAQPLPEWPGLSVLAPADMVLHSMTHLFMNDDTRHALRDLSDLDALLRHFGADAAFWDALIERARLHQLPRLLQYGLRYARRLLGTPVPAAALAAAERFAPALPVQSLMDSLWLSAFDPHGPLQPRLRHRAATAALYVRGHWLRMPTLLLARHLTIKALRLHDRSPGADARPEV
jgi:hypothetical protein